MSEAVWLEARPRVTDALRLLADDDLHLTVCCFPGAAQRSEVVKALGAFISGYGDQSPVKAMVDGLAVFVTPEGPKVVLLVRSEALDRLRLGAREATAGLSLAGGEGLGLGVAHMTLYDLPTEAESIPLSTLDGLPTEVMLTDLVLHIDGSTCQHAVLR